ncbi:hypothetical protein V6N13_052794 [Hibiscus sabdariffa]
MENRKGKRSSVPMNNLVIFLIISLAILPEMTVARHHYNPSLPTPASPPPSETPPSPPKKSDTRGGEVYYLPPNGI